VVYETEQEQIEAIKRWWSENGKFVIAGLVIGLGSVIGWRWWQGHIASQAAAASAQHSQMLDAIQADNNGKAEGIGKTLINDYASTPYAAQAAVDLAGQEVELGHLDQAVGHLSWAMAHGDDAALRLVARLRLAQVLLAQDKPEAALQKLGQAEAGKFQPLYDEARGDAYVALKQYDKASKAYAAALDGLEPGMGDRNLLQMKIDNLPGTAVADSGK